MRLRSAEMEEERREGTRLKEGGEKKTNVGPSGNLNDKVENSLSLVSEERDVAVRKREKKRKVSG